MIKTKNIELRTLIKNKLVKVCYEILENGYEQRYKINIEHSFKEAMSYANVILRNEENTKEDKLLILDYIINTIKMDIQTDVLSNVIYFSEKNKIKALQLLCYPLNYIDENGNCKKIYISEDTEIDVDLSRDFVLSYPWNQTRIADKIKLLYRSDFRYNEDNHIAYYYSVVNICQIINGYHSIAGGIYHKKGKIKAKVLDITPLFENIYTNDGVNWYNKYDNKILCKIKDFRIGLIFEIAKMKIELKKEVNL